MFPTAPTHLDTPPRSSLTSVNTPDPPFAGARTARSERARAALRGRHVIGRRRRRRRRWAFVSLDALKTKWRWQQTNHAVSRADSPTLRRPFRRGGERLEHLRWDLVQGSRPVRRGAPAPAARRTVPARVGDASGAGHPSGSIIFSSSFQRCSSSSIVNPYSRRAGLVAFLNYVDDKDACAFNSSDPTAVAQVPTRERRGGEGLFGTGFVAELAVACGDGESILIFVRMRN